VSETRLLGCALEILGLDANEELLFFEFSSSVESASGILSSVDEGETTFLSLCIDVATSEDLVCLDDIFPELLVGFMLVVD
jgi:hypothetical protein